MSKVKEVEEDVRISYLSAGMSLGLVFGGILGLLIDNLAFSAGGGMLLGLSIGLALEKKRLTSKIK